MAWSKTCLLPIPPNGFPGWQNAWRCHYPRGGSTVAAVSCKPFSQVGPTHQIRSNGWILVFIHIPGQDLATPCVDQQVEVKPDAAHDGGEMDDVPDPILICSCCPEPRHGSWFLCCPCSCASVPLSLIVEHAVNASVRTDVPHLMGKYSHDLAGWQ